MGTALRTAGITTGEHLAWADEMRVGLVSVVRRVWAPVGVKVRQRVQQVREWRYLVVAIRGLGGALVVVLDGEHAERGDRQRSPRLAAEH